MTTRTLNHPAYLEKNNYSGGMRDGVSANLHGDVLRTPGNAALPDLQVLEKEVFPVGGQLPDRCLPDIFVQIRTEGLDKNLRDPTLCLPVGRIDGCREDGTLALQPLVGFEHRHHLLQNTHQSRPVVTTRIVVGGIGTLFGQARVTAQRLDCLGQGVLFRQVSLESQSVAVEELGKPCQNRVEPLRRELLLAQRPEPFLLVFQEGFEHRVNRFIDLMLQRARVELLLESLKDASRGQACQRGGRKVRRPMLLSCENGLFLRLYLREGQGVYRDMEQWTEIRRRVLVEGVSKRQILRDTGMHCTTLEKILAHGAPPGYRQKRDRTKPKIGPHLARIAAILESDRSVPKKQRHTAKRIFERLRDEDGYAGGYTAAKDAVREARRRGREVFMPLSHRPGEAQMDFGFALARVGGVLRKIAFWVMTLPYSDAVFVAAFERECTETFWEGHVRAFRFLGGVPWRITYDNSRVAVSKILESRNRRLTRGFLELKSHYLFDHHFCHVRRANEKGVVENLVGFTRRNFLVPVPQAQLLEEERSAFLALPEGRFDACRKVSTSSNSYNESSLKLGKFHEPNPLTPSGVDPQCAARPACGQCNALCALSPPNDLRHV